MEAVAVTHFLEVLGAGLQTPTAQLFGKASWGQCPQLPKSGGGDADLSCLSSLTQPQVEPGAPLSFRTLVSLHFSGPGSFPSHLSSVRLLLDFLPQVPPHPLAYLPFVPPDSHTAFPSLVPPCLTSRLLVLGYQVLRYLFTYWLVCFRDLGRHLEPYAS